MKVLDLTVKRNDDGSKHLDMQLHGVIDGGWGDEAGDETSSSQFVAALKEHANAATVDVRVNSVGGSAFGGVAMNTALRNHAGKTRGIVEGLAASAASIAVLGCKSVEMGRGAMMMIHSPSAIAMGNARDMRKTADFLDKVQNALASVYVEKTGKSLDDINAMLDDETWMTADEAVAAGFADSVSATEAEPDPNDPSEGNEPPEDRGEQVIWNGVAFPRAAIPGSTEQILAMAKRSGVSERKFFIVNVEPPACAPPVPPVLALVPPLVPPPPITRAELQLSSPDLLASIVADGHAAGVAAERARLKAIDELAIAGCAELVAAAKYGEKPSDAPTLAVAIVKAGQHAGAELLRNRIAESAPVAGVMPGAPDQTQAAAQSRLIQAMTEGGNAHRGGE